MKSLIAVLCLCMYAMPASADNIERALKAALEGPEVKKLRIHGHEFNVKPVSIKVEGKKITVGGHISHHLSWRPDDQVHYTIQIEDRKILDINTEIDRGGWAGIAGPVGTAVGAYFGVPIPPKAITEAGRAAGKLIDGSWEGACRFIIFNVGLRVVELYSPQKE